MKNKILSYQSLHTSFAALLLRLIVGGLFVYYGYMKIISYDKILPLFKNYIGIGATLSFNLLIFAEFFCGILVIIGFLTRLAIVPIFIAMLVAFFIAHAKDPFDEKQLAFLFLLLSFVIFILGSGKFSVDRIVFKKRG